MSEHVEGISLRAQRCLVGSVVWVSGRRPIRGCYRVDQPTTGLIPANFERCNGRPRACAGERTPGPPALPTCRRVFGERKHTRTVGPAQMEACSAGLPTCRQGGFYILEGSHSAITGKLIRITSRRMSVATKGSTP